MRAQYNHDSARLRITKKIMRGKNVKKSSAGFPRATAIPGSMVANRRIANGTVETDRMILSRIAATSLNQNPAKLMDVPAIAVGGATAMAAAPPGSPAA